mgnify:CR=1 FL=1
MNEDEIASEMFARLGVRVQAKEGQKDVRRRGWWRDGNAEEAQDLKKDRKSVLAPYQGGTAGQER